MASDDRLRRRLVDDLRESGFLRGERVAAAFDAVPRHLFLPGQPLDDVYTNRAFVTKSAAGIGLSSSSQPSIMAVMLEQLELEPGQRVLEIGAGTGYNAALIAHLVGQAGRVTTVDIDEDTADAAREHLRAAGDDGVEVVTADGGFGHPGGAPYDRIVVTASCWQVPQPWVDQLAESGLLVLPLRLNGAHVCIALRKRGDELEGERACECGFMPLRGAFGAQGFLMKAGDLRVGGDVDLGEGWRAALASTLEDGRAVRVAFPRARDERNGPLCYLVLQGKPVLTLLRSTTTWGELPFGLAAGPDSVVLLPWWRAKRGKLTLYGTDEALGFLRGALERWRSEGRPDVRNLRVRVWRSDEELGALPQRVGGRYRFRRGEHVYEVWFER
jgi:protein-L-isoaspartate(D-aspartate) O-methyltransferase